jgi:hypothetical protein
MARDKEGCEEIRRWLPDLSEDQAESRAWKEQVTPDASGRVTMGDHVLEFDRTPAWDQDL